MIKPKIMLRSQLNRLLKEHRDNNLPMVENEECYTYEGRPIIIIDDEGNSNESEIRK